MNLLIVTGIFPPDVGGPATYVPQIAAFMHKRGHQVAVITLSDDSGLRHEGFAFRVVRVGRNRFKFWRWLQTVMTIVRLGRTADILFVNGLAMETMVANLWLHKPVVQKVVGDLAWEVSVSNQWTDDGFEVFQQKRYGPKIELLKALRSWWVTRADRVIVPSQYLARWIGGWGFPAHRIRVIYNAAPTDGRAQEPATTLRATLKAITVCRLVRWKHVDGILHAIAQVPALELLVLGDGPERPRLDYIAARLGIRDRVEFTGHRPQEHIMSLMQACDLFILNSSYEGLPHVVLEAMAAGLPVIATRAGGVPEIIIDEENGLLVRPGDLEGLTEAIWRLVLDEGLRVRLSIGATRTLTRFRWSELVEHVCGVMSEVGGSAR